MNSRRIAVIILAVGLPLFLGSVAYLVFGESAHKGTASLVGGGGFALVCLSQALLVLAKRH